MTSATDRNVDAVIAAVFGAGGITACQDTLPYDTRLQRVQESILPTVPSKLRQHFDAEVEPCCAVTWRSAAPDGRIMLAKALITC